MADPIAIQAEACRVLREHLGADRVFYADVGEDDRAHIAIDSHAESVASIVGEHQLSDFGLRPITALRAGGALVYESMEMLEGFTLDEQGAYRSLDVAAQVKVPLVKEKGHAHREDNQAAPSHETARRLVAFFGVHQAQPRA